MQRIRGFALLLPRPAFEDRSVEPEADSQLCNHVPMLLGQGRHINDLEISHGAHIKEVQRNQRLGVEMGSVSKIFSRRTLEKFEDASASIPLHQMDRAFEAANIRMGKDPGGSGGARKTQFRRYIAGVDQHDPQQLDRLGDALGALIDEVAASKKDFLVKAAETDGFFFGDGVFRPAGTAPTSFAVASLEELAFIDDRVRRLHLLADDSPEDAIGGAQALVESVCRTVLRAIGEPAPKKTTDIVDIAKSTLNALELVPADIDNAKRAAAILRRSLQQLSAVVSSLDELRKVYGCGDERDGRLKIVSPRHARLAVGAAVTFAGFLAETVCGAGHIELTAKTADGARI